MTDVLDNINAYLYDNFSVTIPTPHVIDVLEIMIIAFFIYEILVWIKNSRAYMLLRGIVVIVLFFVVAGILQMNTILWLGERLLNVGIIALVVVFQPELRSALEQLGRRNLFQALARGFSKNAGERFNDHTLNDLVKACYDMGAVKTGALIVNQEQAELLAQYEKSASMHFALEYRGDAATAQKYLDRQNEYFASKGE